ncbi:MAG: laccase domain-containing protein, partial [bacterium]
MKGPLLLDQPWGLEGLCGFTSTRQGGTSVGAYDSLNLGLNTADAPAAVVRNRRLALEARGLDPAKAVYACQVHGDGIMEVTAADEGSGTLDWNRGLPDCDAVFTRCRGLPLCIGHADCLVVAVADPVAGLLGLAHAGWRGALAELPAKLLR